MKRSINYLHIGILIIGYFLLSFVANVVRTIIQRKRQLANNANQPTTLMVPVPAPTENQTEIIGFHPVQIKENEVE